MSTFLLLGLMANAYRCYDPASGVDHNVDIKVEVTFVQGFTSRWNEIQEDLNSAMAELVQKVDQTFNVDLDGNPVSDRVKFSFHRTTDKSTNQLPECDGPNSCSCNDPLENVDGSYQWTLDQLQCSDVSNCRGINDFFSGTWTDLSFRTDVLDAPLEIAQPYLDVPTEDLETGQRTVRVTAILADNCARESGRSTADAERRAWYWTGIPKNFQDDWSNYPDVDEDGTILDPFISCALRDYPTMDEFMRAMKRSSTSLAFFWRNGDVCGGTGFDGFNEPAHFYPMHMGNAATFHGVWDTAAEWAEGGTNEINATRLTRAIWEAAELFACPIVVPPTDPPTTLTPPPVAHDHDNTILLPTTETPLPKAANTTKEANSLWQWAAGWYLDH